MTRFLTLAVAFTLGALVANVRSERARADEIGFYESLLADERVNAERAYLDGLRDAGGAVESCTDRPDLCSDERPEATLARMGGQ